MAGYIRQDIANEIDNGQVIQAPPLDAEFNALVAAFSAASGHKHNGTSGEGAPITVVGPAQDLVVSTNSTTPKTDNVMDLGSSTLEFKDLWIDGTANIDTLTADAGTVGGAAITTISNTQTLTNKTIDLTNNTLVATSAQVAAAVTDETGTGALVFANSPALAGTPTAPTAAAATNTTQVATTAHVFAERSNAASLTNKTIDLTNNTLVATSAQVAAAVTDETGTGALVFAGSPALTGTPTAPTAVAGTNTTQLATTAHVFAERTNTATLTNKTLTSPTITGGTITGGTITGITDLAVADGGTGASTPEDARTNLGAQAADANLTSISALGTAADRMIYTTGVDTWAETPSTAFGRSLMDDADAAEGRTTLGLGTIATQDAASVAITGGSVTGITDLAIADGGTGASDAAGARTNLGLAIGTNVQAYDAALGSLAGLSWVADRYPYATGVDTFAMGTITAAGRALLDDADAAAQLTTLGAQASDATLTSLSGLTLAAGDILYATAADTLVNLAKGAAGQVLRMNSGATAPEWGSGIALQSSQASTSGTEVSFSGIPAGVKRVTLLLNKVSLSGTDSFLVQLGTSGGPVTSGYVCWSSAMSGSAVGGGNSASGFRIDHANASTGATSGRFVAERLAPGSNVWIATFNGVRISALPSTTDGSYNCGGEIDLGAELTQIRLTRSGTNTFDNGNVGASWEA